MIILILGTLLLIFYFSICFRLVVKHPYAFLAYSLRDFFSYFKYKKYNVCRTGELVGFVSLTQKVFGNGKTLSCVHTVLQKYNKYNNTTIWDSERNMFVRQVVQVISNVHLVGVPYEQFVSLKQVVRASEVNRSNDLENDTLTVTLVIGDEFSVQLNSRSFKDNIDPLFLNTILTSRHHHISLYYTTQRPSLVDALLRNVTSYYVACDKIWRFQKQNIYDAWEMENATSPAMLTPLQRTGFFVFDTDYKAYDTLACVENLEKACAKGDMLTEAEIMSLRQNSDFSPDNIMNPSRKLSKLRKRMR